LVVPPFIEQFQKLIELLPIAWEKLRLQIVVLKHQHFEWLPPPPTGANLTKQLQPLGTLLFKNFVTFFSNTVSVIVQLFLVIILTLMMLVSPQNYINAILKLFPSFYRTKAKIIFEKCEDSLGNWLSGTVVNCLFIGILSGIGLYFLKVDLVLAHSLLAGVLNFIPNIGPTTSVIFPIMVALVDAPWKVVAILIWYFIIQNIESYLLTPTVMAKQVSLLPAVTLLAQIFFTQTFGVLGLLLALPLTVFTKIWIEEFLFKEVLDQWEIK
jgi:predicted PurR-regulated permease PerM